MFDDVSIDVIIGETFDSVVGEVGGETIRFLRADGTGFKMYHDQNCCESVTVEDICGSLEDLIGSPIRLASADTNSETNPDGTGPQDDYDSFTWTFYNIATAKGHVTIRWYGESNGYYSESVDIMEIKA